MSHATYTFLVDWDSRFRTEENEKAAKRAFHNWIEQYGDENNWFNFLTLYYPGSPSQSSCCRDLKEYSPGELPTGDTFTDMITRRMNAGMSHGIWGTMYYVSQCVGYEVCPHGHPVYVDGRTDESKPSTVMDYKVAHDNVVEYMNTDFQYAVGMAYLEKGDYLKAAAVGLMEGSWYLSKFRAAQMVDAYTSAEVPFFAIPGYGGPYDWRAFDLRSDEYTSEKEKEKPLILDILPQDTAFLFVRIHT